MTLERHVVSHLDSPLLFGLVKGVTKRESGRKGNEKLARSEDYVILGVQITSGSSLLQITECFGAVRAHWMTLDIARHRCCVYHVLTKLHARLPSALSATSPTLGTLPDVALFTA
jgi:hypothetical protein